MAAPVESPRHTRQIFDEFAKTRENGLRDQLIEAHLGLAHSLARRFTNRGEPYEDLVQVASMALVEAVDRFDPGMGVEFSTFATQTLMGQLKRHFRDKGWAMRVPRRLQEIYLELGHAVDSLTQELGRPPTVAEMARATGYTEEAVLQAQEAGQSYRIPSIDTPGHHEGTIADRLGESDTNFAGADDRMMLALSMANLTDRERTILKLRFVDGLTQSKIASEIGMSQMHVSRLLKGSLAKLREAFVAET